MFNLDDFTDTTGAFISRMDGYPLSYRDVWGHVFCPRCATKAIEADGRDEITGASINWNDPHLICGTCDNPIPAAYGKEVK